ncbi:MAG: HPr(Ser) kinase/phosphatase [Thermoplasmata archaeon]|nr:MAG: HPr(Ser) kinase/phosphatase [Thermoplasmata archaeon]
MLTPKYLTVQELLDEQAERLKLTLLGGKNGLNRKISCPRIQKPGLALTGYFTQLRSERVQILGNTEWSFLQTLTVERRQEVLTSICKMSISCFVLTKNLLPPPELIKLGNKYKIPILQSILQSSVFIRQISTYMEEKLAPETSIHGVLMDIYGRGVLLLGKSSIGKSECALDLIVRGHRLVSDDMVNIKLISPDVLIGSGPELIRYHMELRGLGIINIKDLFGVAAVRYRKKIELAVMMEEWKEEFEYDRLGLEESKITILGIDLPLIKMPVAPGRNMAIIIEVAARNQLLKESGYYSARDFDEKVIGRLKKRPP